MVLRNEEGECINDLVTMQHHIVQYFSKLFRAIDGDLECDTVIWNVLNRVSTEANNRLLTALNSEEIRCAIFQIHPDKAPGPDDMNPAFF